MDNNNTSIFHNGKIKHELIKDSKRFKIQFGSVEGRANKCSSFFIKGKAMIGLCNNSTLPNFETVVADFKADAQSKLNKILSSKYKTKFHKNHLLDVEFSISALRAKNPKNAKINYTIYLRTLEPKRYEEFYDEAQSLSADFNDILINTTAPNLNLSISDYN